MMPPLSLVLAVFALAFSAAASAAGFVCAPIAGNINTFVPNVNPGGVPTCAVKSAQSPHFPDMTLLYDIMPKTAGAQPTCFSGTLTGTLYGTVPIRGTFSSGLTVNGVAENTAVSDLRLYLRNSPFTYIGELYTKDVIFDIDNPNNTREILSVVDSDNDFRGSLEIDGNALVNGAFNTPTPFSGKLCYNP